VPNRAYIISKTPCEGGDILHLKIPSLKTPVGKNRRYDICSCIDVSSLKTLYEKSEEEKLIKEKGTI
jgi:hypothetical protein